MLKNLLFKLDWFLCKGCKKQGIFLEVNPPRKSATDKILSIQFTEFCRDCEEDYVLVMWGESITSRIRSYFRLQEG